MKKLIIALAVLVFATPALTDEVSDLLMQYSKLQSLKSYYEGKVEQTIININTLELRFKTIKAEQQKQTEDKKSDEKNTPDDSDKSMP